MHWREFLCRPCLSQSLGRSYCFFPPIPTCIGDIGMAWEFSVTHLSSAFTVAFIFGGYSGPRDVAIFLTPKRLHQTTWFSNEWRTAKRLNPTCRRGWMGCGGADGTG